ncbi:hypothetical protein [Coleofasciculus chthonoplastes]|nr:hypothetical protein [Coleofasciculus chthonoplastes]
MARLYNGAERPNRCVYCYIAKKSGTLVDVPLPPSIYNLISGLLNP